MPTIRGHARLVIKRWAWLAFMTVLAVASFYACIAWKSIGLTVLCVFFYPFMLTLTFVAVWRTQRVKNILSTYPWRAYPCSYPPRALEQPVVIRIRFSEQYAPTLRITPFSVELDRKQNPQPDMIWFAGDPRYGGVVSPVGGHYPVRVVPEDMGDGVPGGAPEEDVLAERAGLVKGGKARQS